MDKIIEGNQLWEKINRTSLSNENYVAQITRQCCIFAKFLKTEILKQLIESESHDIEIKPIEIPQSITDQCIDFIYFPKNTNYSSHQNRAILADHYSKILFDTFTSCGDIVNTEGRYQVDISIYCEPYKKIMIGKPSMLYDFFNTNEIIKKKVYTNLKAFKIKMRSVPPAPKKSRRLCLPFHF